MKNNAEPRFWIKSEALKGAVMGPRSCIQQGTPAFEKSINGSAKGSQANQRQAPLVSLQVARLMQPAPQVTKTYETKLETLESEKALTVENLAEWLDARCDVGGALELPKTQPIRSLGRDLGG